MFPEVNGVPPLLVWGWAPRLLGIVYFIAFTSLWRDVLMQAGSRGVSPVAPLLARIRRDFPDARRFVFFPTLLWFGASDRALRFLLAAGAGSALLAVWGGPTGFLALLVCWAVLLSFDIAFDLAFPWDAVLFEAGFLALFLPATHALPEVSAVAAPLPVVAWGFRWLLFRVLFGFGKYKFPPGSKFDWTYLRGFLIVQPIPTPLAWFGSKLPGIFHRIAIVIMFVVEIPLPFLLFTTGLPRLIAAAGIFTLMIVIQLSGNYGYFNVLVAALCVPALDLHTSVGQISLAQVAAFPFTHLVFAVLLLGGLLHLPFASWVARGWLYWPTLQGKLPAPIQALVTFYRLLLPFRIVQAYGVFPPEGSPVIRWIPLFEGSADGVTWQPYEFRYIPSLPSSRPKFVAPYCPRLDHRTYYEPYGAWYHNLLGSFVSAGIPYRFTRRSPIECIAQRLLEGGGDVGAQFSRNPFPDPARPPWKVRVRYALLTPTTWAEKRRTGDWWTTQDCGTYMPETGRIEGFWEDLLPEPELFHWDELCWRKRIRSFDRLRAPEAATDVAQALTDAAVSPADVDAFWRDFVPALQTSARADWRALPALWRTLDARFTPAQLRAFELFAARLAHVLATRLEPYFMGGEQPRIEVPTWLQLGLLVHAAIAEGEAACTALLRQPQSAQSRVSGLTNESGLLLWATFRRDLFVLHARAARVFHRTWPPNPNRQIPKGLPGFIYLLRWMSEQFPDPVELPRWERGEDLEWRLEGETPTVLDPAAP